MNQQLSALFDNGTLIRPSDRQPNLIHLVRAIGSLAGVPELDHAPPTQQLKQAIGPFDHLIFILLDGLGMSTLRRLPSDSLLACTCKLTLHATCPSTTACALTSVTTAQYPNRHGILGWFTHLPEFGLTAMILPFAERMTGEPLTRRGINAEAVLPLRPIIPRMTHTPLTLVPAAIANSTYNTYSRGPTAGIGYTSLHNAVDEIITRISTATAPTYTHLYLPDVDSMCHKFGVQDPRITPLVMQIDTQLQRLREALHGRNARLIISADHGLIDVPAAAQTVLLDGDPMLDLLAIPPSGDARMPIFHVREAKHTAFERLFHDRYAGQFVLVTAADVENMELLGPGPLSDLTRRRLGDYIAIPFLPAMLEYKPPCKARGELYKAVHAGLSPEEMEVPLCLA